MRIASGLAVVLAALLALPDGAAAGTARVTQSTTEAPKSAPIRMAQAAFTAAPGEANVLTVTPESDANAVVFHDDGADLAAGEGCTAVDSRTVRCTRPAATDSFAVTAELGDMNDTATATGGLLVNVGAGAGNDVVSSDLARGEEGDDMLAGGPAISTLTGGPGDDQLSGGGGDDTLTGDLGADMLDGGDGSDTASWEQRSEDITIDLSDPAPDGAAGEGDTLTNVENARTGAGSDTLRGDGGPNVLGSGFLGDDVVSGGGGDDRLGSGDGADRLSGEAGDDQLDPGAGRDRVDGGAGDDDLTLEFDGAGTPDRIACGAGRDVARDPQRTDFVPRDCERIVLDLVGISPLTSSSTRAVPVRVDQDPNGLARECGRIRLGQPAGAFGALAFDMPRPGRSKKVRVPLTRRGRAALARSGEARVPLRFELRDRSCSRAVLRHTADLTGGFRFGL